MTFMCFRYISTYFYLIRVNFALYVLSWLFLQFCLFYGLLCIFWRFYPVFWLKFAFSCLFFWFLRTLWLFGVGFLNAARLSMRLTPVLFHVKLFVIHTNNTLLHERGRVLPYLQFSGVFIFRCYTTCFSYKYICFTWNFFQGTQNKWKFKKMYEIRV